MGKQLLVDSKIINLKENVQYKVFKDGHILETWSMEKNKDKGYMRIQYHKNHMKVSSLMINTKEKAYIEMIRLALFTKVPLKTVI